jgi:predicted HicB family RNase H-like nuclease
MEDGFMRQGRYVAKVTYWSDDDRFHGEVINLGRDGIHFAGRSVAELRASFACQVAGYEDLVPQPWAGTPAGALQFRGSQGPGPADG